MNAHILFRNNDILVTPAMARFGPVSYQMSAISSIAVYHRPKLNPIAVTLVAAAFGLAAFAYFGREQQPDYSLWSAIAAPIALILGIAWQRMRPVLEYRLVMKSAGSETETVTTFDREQVFELREAIETAFHMQQSELEMQQYRSVDENGVDRTEPRMGDERSDDGLITRDWVVGNVDLAPR
ncbi:MAG TPA: DUF6232 family protein [Xanthobacteraceae bacterium]|nr:DUF6232 family protein [Xanthobacteraceae bacterium]